MTFRKIVALAGGVCLIVLAGACGSSTAPNGSVTNPANISTDAGALKGTFQTPAFSSLGVLDQSIALGALPAPPAVVGAGRLLGATRPMSEYGKREPGRQRILRAEALRRLAPHLITAQRLPVIPPAALGKTFEYDLQTNQYADLGTLGAPAGGIRIILYAVDPITGQIVIQPLTQTGYVDLIDLQPGSPSAKQIEVILVGTTGQTPVTYADYTVGVTVTSASSFSATSAGYVTNGTDRADFTLSVSVSVPSQTQTTINADASLTVNNSAFTVRQIESLVFNDPTLTFTVDFRYTSGENSLRITGTIVGSKVTTTVTVDVTVTANGGTFATITGTLIPLNLTATGPGGRQLTQAERQALADLLDNDDDIFDRLGAMVAPAFDLLSLDSGGV